LRAVSVARSWKSWSLSFTSLVFIGGNITVENSLRSGAATPKIETESSLPNFAKLTMRAVIQRVSEASVTIKGSIKSAIRTGLLVLLAIEEADTNEDIEWLSGKIVRLRVFNDEEGLMNRSVQDVNGEILLVSQFTLFASTKKGNRPSFIRSAKPEIATPLMEKFITRLTQDFGKPIQTGEFGAHMRVSLLNDGPVTIIIDSKSRE
jgi:D-tyrosyl-tRNA(Tyr) deacylase